MQKNTARVVNDKKQMAWQKEYLKRGPAGLSQFSIETFWALSRKYRYEVFTFLRDMYSVVSQSPNHPFVTYLQQGMDNCLILARYYERLADGDSRHPLIDKDILDLNSRLENLSKLFSAIEAQKEHDESLSKGMIAAEGSVGLKFDEVKRRHTVGTGLTRRADSDKKGSNWLSASGDFLQSGGDTRTSLLSFVAGGATPFVEMGLTGIGKLLSFAGKKRQESKLASRLRAGRETISNLGEIPGSVLGGLEDMGYGKQMETFLSKFPGLMGLTAGGGPGGGLGMSKQQIADGLFTFFNEPALKAQWTRRILKAIERGSGIGDGGGGDVGSGKGISWKNIATTVASVGGGMTLPKGLRWLGKLFGIGGKAAAGATLGTNAGLGTSATFGVAKTATLGTAATLGSSTTGSLVPPVARVAGTSATATLGGVALAVLGIVGAALAGAALGTFLRKLFPQIDEFLSGENGVFTKAMMQFDKHKDSIKSASKDPSKFGLTGVGTGLAKKLSNSMKSDKDAPKNSFSYMMNPAIELQKSIIEKLVSIRETSEKLRETERQPANRISPSQNGVDPHNSEDTIMETFNGSPIGNKNGLV